MKAYTVTLRSKYKPHRIIADTIAEEGGRLVFRGAKSGAIVAMFDQKYVVGYSEEPEPPHIRVSFVKTASGPGGLRARG
jgi:hypothetical protein